MNKAASILTLSLAKSLGYSWCILFNLRTTENEPDDFCVLPHFFKTEEDAITALKTICGNSQYEPLFTERGEGHGRACYRFKFTALCIKARTLTQDRAIKDLKNYSKATIRFVDLDTLS